MSNAFIELRLRIDPVKNLVHELQFAAVKEVFDLDIKPEAVKNSPVTPEGLEYNFEKGKTGTALKGTGTNRRSIDDEVVQTERGVEATLFTQSGYGGYLETGTSKMRAQPYIYPAWLKFKDKIALILKQKLGEL